MRQPPLCRVFIAVATSATLTGCSCLKIHTDNQVTAAVKGNFEVKTPTFPDLGPMVPRVVRCAGGGAGGRVAIIGVDGILVNQNLTGPNSAGENPVAAFREKLAVAACDPSVRAV